jgi:hypothetical protein
LRRWLGELNALGPKRQALPVAGLNEIWNCAMLEHLLDTELRLLILNLGMFRLFIAYQWH